MILKIIGLTCFIKLNCVKTIFRVIVLFVIIVNEEFVKAVIRLFHLKISPILFQILLFVK